jgi:hypothetical protein
MRRARLCHHYKYYDYYDYEARDFGQSFTVYNCILFYYYYYLLSLLPLFNESLWVWVSVETRFTNDDDADRR